LAANRKRDVETARLLEAEGWRVVRIWEHEDPVQAARRVAEVVLAIDRPGCLDVETASAR
jgi:DNA mismatch endonuclease (patch repair protein)